MQTVMGCEGSARSNVSAAPMYARVGLILRQRAKTIRATNIAAHAPQAPSRQRSIPQLNGIFGAIYMQPGRWEAAPASGNSLI
jgi:hypothetical protein